MTIMAMSLPGKFQILQCRECQWMKHLHALFCQATCWFLKQSIWTFSHKETLRQLQWQTLPVKWKKFQSNRERTHTEAHKLIIRYSPIQMCQHPACFNKGRQWENWCAEKVLLFPWFNQAEGSFSNDKVLFKTSYHPVNNQLLSWWKR